MPALPVEEASIMPVMWRVYGVGISPANKLALAGAHGARWDDVEFSATCDKYGNSLGSSVASEMRNRIHSSHVILPGQMPRRPSELDASNERKVAHKRCIMHLEAGTCACGVWGYKSPSRLQHDGYLSSKFWTGRGGNQLEILCAVRCYGTVLQGSWGYRASNVEIEAMFVPAVEDAYIELDANMKPKMSGVIAPITTVASGYSSLPKRLDPEAIYHRLQKDFSCQVIPVPEGLAWIRMLDQEHPDPVYKPIGYVPPAPVLQNGDVLSGWTFPPIISTEE